MAMANLEAELVLQWFDRSDREPQPTDARGWVPTARQLVLKLLQPDARTRQTSSLHKVNISVIVRSGRRNRAQAKAASRNFDRLS